MTLKRKLGLSLMTYLVGCEQQVIIGTFRHHYRESVEVISRFEKRILAFSSCWVFHRTELFVSKYVNKKTFLVRCNSNLSISAFRGHVFLGDLSFSYVL